MPCVTTLLRVLLRFINIIILINVIITVNGVKLYSDDWSQFWALVLVPVCFVHGYLISFHTFQSQYHKSIHGKLSLIFLSIAFGFCVYIIWHIKSLTDKEIVCYFCICINYYMVSMINITAHFMTFVVSVIMENEIDIFDDEEEELIDEDEDEYSDA